MTGSAAPKARRSSTGRHRNPCGHRCCVLGTSRRHSPAIPVRSGPPSLLGDSRPLRQTKPRPTGTGPSTVRFVQDGAPSARHFVGGGAARFRKTELDMKPRIKVLTLAVSDLERSLAFYRDGLGLPTQRVIGQEFEDG